MIQPTTGLSGTGSNRITVQALNDGEVWINGEGVRTPILLNQNDYFSLRGFGFYNSNGPAAYIYLCTQPRLYRMCGWDAASGNFHVFSFDQCNTPLAEDCAGWGRGRKIFESYAGQDATFRRCFFIWTTHSDGGPGMELSYSSNGTTAENCIGAWRRTGSAPSGPAGIFGWTGSSTGNDDSKLLGSIAYVRSSYTVDTNLIVCGNNGYVDVDMENVASYVQPGSHLTRAPFSLNNATNASANKITSIGGAADATGNWTVTNHVDSATAVTIFSGSGAVIGYRYVDRTLTSDPLWPWPMDNRIDAGLSRSGYPSVTDGFTNDSGLVTDAIEEMFGTAIPPEFEGDPPPEEDEEAPGGSQDPDVVGSTTTGREWHTLCKIFLDTGTQYYSKKDVQHPDYLYEGRIKSFGYVDRSIPVPTGLPQLGDCRIQIIDTDKALRDVLANQTPRRRLIELRNVPEGGSESAYPPFATFEIYDFEQYDGIMEISGRDINFSWIDKEIPGLGNRTNFPDMMDGVDEVFIPIICGVLDAPSEASPPNPQGVLTLPRMTLTRWGLAQHPILYVELCGRIDPSDEFTLIPDTDYVITEEAMTIDGVGYTLSFIDFNSDQDLALEVRCRIVEGFYTRGAFGNMPAVINSPLTALRNPVDAWINVNYGVLAREVRIPRFDTDSFLEVHALLDSEFITSTSPGSPYACDFAIDRPMTSREFIGQWMTSFEIDLYVNRYGQLSMNVTHEEDEDRPVFSQGPVYGEATDNSLILWNSVRQRSANPTCNRLRYNFGFNYSTDQFQYKDIFDNEDDQLSLGSDLSPVIPEVEEDTLELMCVRDPIVAEDVARRRMEWLALGSYRIEWNMPLPQTFDDLELTKLVGVTSEWGFQIDGYHDKEVKITGLTYDLDRKVVTTRAIVRIPQTVDQHVHELPPEAFTGDTYIEGYDLGLGSDAAGVKTFRRSMFYVPTGLDTDTTTFYLEAVYQNLDAVDRTANVYPVSSFTGALVVGAPIPITLTASSTRRRTRTSQVTITPGTVYVVQTPQTTSDNNVQIYRVRVVCSHLNATQSASEIRLSNASTATIDDQTIGGGDIFRTTNSGLPDTTSGFTSVTGPRFTWQEDKWQTITRLHLIHVLANASFTPETKWSEAILYDLTAAAYVEGTRIATNGDFFLNPTPVSADILASALTDGHTYEVRIRSVKTTEGASDFNTYYHGSRLNIDIEPIEAMEWHARCGNAQGVGEERMLHGEAIIPDTDVVFEAHGAVGTTYTLQSFGTSDTATTGGTPVAAAEVTISDSTTKFARTQDVREALAGLDRYGSAGNIQGSIITRFPQIPVVLPFTVNSVRREYIEYLYDQHMPPVMAVLFEEGTGNPTDLISGATLSPGGSPSWTTDGTYGIAGRCSATTDYWKVDNNGLIIPTTYGTMLVIRKKADTTARSVNLAGLTTDFFGRWFFAYAPQSNGQVRFGVGGDELVWSGYSITTNVEAWGFRWTPAGRSIWLNGTNSASNATTQTRTASNSTDDFGINLANSNNPNGDIQDFYAVIFIRGYVPDAVMASFTPSNVLLGM